MNDLPPIVLGPVVLWADLAGIFVSALGGALLAVRHKLDVFGVFVLAIVTGLAGGMARDVLIGATPVAALANPLYLPSALAAGAVVFFGHRVIERAVLGVETGIAESELAEAVEGDLGEKARRDDAVGVDILERQHGGA